MLECKARNQHLHTLTDNISTYLIILKYNERNYDFYHLISDIFPPLKYCNNVKLYALKTGP